MDEQLFAALLQSVKDAKRIAQDETQPVGDFTPTGVSLEEFMSDFTPDQRARVEHRAQVLIRGETALRKLVLEMARAAYNALCHDHITWGDLHERAMHDPELAESIEHLAAMDRADALERKQIEQQSERQSIHEMHRQWMNKPDYREAYEGLRDEFTQARIDIWRKLRTRYSETFIAIEQMINNPPLKLSTRDSEIFAQALLNPRPPSDRLREAVAHYRETVDSRDDDDYDALENLEELIRRNAAAGPAAADSLEE